MISNLSLTAGVVDKPHGAHGPALHDLKGKTARGALVSTFGQGASFFLRMGSTVVLARLLAPADFGLVGMATACTGFLELFRDVGLSMATVQCASITRAQTSMLFWVNLLVGGMLAALCAALAPILTVFYHEPRLFWVTVLLGAGFVFNGAAVQHRAILQRDMRFAILTVLDIISVFISVAVGIAMAAAGQGYWALVGMTVCVPIVGVLGVWTVGGWMPTRPRCGVRVRSMLQYGGMVTLKNVVNYIAFNTDKVLLGRFWGAEALGIYGRAYQLINLPTQNLNSAIGQVAVPALSRLQNDSQRLRSYFLKGYGLFLSLVMPVTMGCALFAEDIVLVFLGPKWGGAVPLFRMLAPTILTIALINPLAWLVLAVGRAQRGLKIAMAMAPVVILGYVAGLSRGPIGVAEGFSITTVLLVVPVIFWATRGTSITTVDTFKVIMRPFLSMLIGACTIMATWSLIHLLAQPIFRLIAANAIFFGVYIVVLWFVMGQKAVYLGLLREIGVWPISSWSRKKGSLAHGDA
jgi:O-antigen/teichoic acid export membrane protein